MDDTLAGLIDLHVRRVSTQCAADDDSSSDDGASLSSILPATITKLVEAAPMANDSPKGYLAALFLPEQGDMLTAVVKQDIAEQMQTCSMHTMCQLT